jgi:hypothetical protein
LDLQQTKGKQVMKTPDIVGGIFILIFLYLVINKAETSAKIIQSLTGGVTQTIAVLQGRGSNVG